MVVGIVDGCGTETLDGGGTVMLESCGIVGKGPGDV